MAFLKNKPATTFRLNLVLTRQTINRIELLRRGLELDPRDLLAGIIEQGVDEVFHARMSELDVFPEINGLDPEVKAEFDARQAAEASAAATE